MRFLPILRYEQHPGALRCYVGRRRLHHGLVGLVLATLGAALAWHDRADAPRWLEDWRGGE